MDNPCTVCNVYIPSQVAAEKIIDAVAKCHLPECPRVKHTNVHAGNTYVFFKGREIQRWRHVKAVRTEIREGIKHEELPEVNGVVLRRRTFKGRTNGVMTNWRLVAYDYMDERLNKSLRSLDDVLAELCPGSVSLPRATDDRFFRPQPQALKSMRSRTPFSAAASPPNFEVHPSGSPRGLVPVMRSNTPTVPASRLLDDRQLSIPLYVPSRPRHGVDDDMIHRFPDLTGH